MCSPVWIVTWPLFIRFFMLAYVAAGEFQSGTSPFWVFGCCVSCLAVQPTTSGPWSTWGCSVASWPAPSSSCFSVAFRFCALWLVQARGKRRETRSLLTKPSWGRSLRSPPSPAFSACGSLRFWCPVPYSVLGWWRRTFPVFWRFLCCGSVCPAVWSYLCFIYSKPERYSVDTMVVMKDKKWSLQRTKLFWFKLKNWSNSDLEVMRFVGRSLEKSFSRVKSGSVKTKLFIIANKIIRKLNIKTFKFIIISNNRSFQNC